MLCRVVVMTACPELARKAVATAFSGIEAMLVGKNVRPQKGMSLGI